MRNTIKLFGIIALVAVIGFSFVACGGDDDSGGGDSIPGGTVTYPDGTVDKPTDFNYVYWYSDAFTPISTINESASVTISGGKADIKLGIPKNTVLLSRLFHGDITITPSDAKGFPLTGYFTTVDKEYFLVCTKGNSGAESNQVAILIYAEQDTTVKGTYKDDKVSWSYDLSLKKGWNYMVDSVGGKAATSSVSMPSGFTWQVVDKDYVYGR